MERGSTRYPELRVFRTAAFLGLPDEGRDALMHAALEPPDAALDQWRRWEASGAGLWADPVASRWLPLVGWNLRDTALDDRSRRALRAVQRRTWAGNVRLLAAVTPALDALAAAGIPVMLLKGAPLAFTVFETPGLRPLGDIDVLIDPDRVDAADAVLAEAGWFPSRQVANRERLSLHGLDYRKAPHGVLDLHWYLLHECCWPGADAGVWQRAVPIVMAGRALLSPSPADHLLHVCLHGLRWSPVHSAHWIADAIRIIRHAASDLDWDTLAEEAAKRELAHQMRESLLLLRVIWDAAVPEEILRRLQVQRPSFCDRLECTVKGQPRASFGGLFLIWRNWRRLARAPGRPRFLRYLATIVEVDSLWRLVPFGGRHLAIRLFAPWRRPRGTSSRQKLLRRPES